MKTLYAPYVGVLVLASALTACGGGAAPPANTVPAVPMQIHQQPERTTSAVTQRADTAAAAGASIIYTHYLNFKKLNVAPQRSTAIVVHSPLDLSFHGGPTVTTTVSTPIYVNCAASCWGTAGRGDAGTFLSDFGKSNFVHILDQYTGSTANDRYTLGPAVNLSLKLKHIIGDPEILAIVHAVAKTGGTGLGHVYHVFLKPGQDMCSGSATNCYSPDRPASFIFCAFHAAVKFSDIGVVLFSVEPFQFVPGCAVNTPHGVIDATSSTLSHELSETITDPEGDAWFNQLFLLEIGDICFAFRDDDNLSGEFFSIQPEYSNNAHNCVNGV